ncbi:MAG: hypothetical protein WA705_18645 [Candidatus Ozemobacteraceae bacterium]
MSACKNGLLEYSGSRGGGIDILARVGIGGAVSLCVMEVKDENRPNEPAAKVIQQALAYSTFLRGLLRSDCGENWWHIFGFKGKLPEKLNIYVACVMPSLSEEDTPFSKKEICVEADCLHLHYIGFHPTEN